MYDLRGSSLSFQHTCSSRSISEKLPLTLEISKKRQHEHAKLQKKKEYCKTHDTSQPMMHAEGAVAKKLGVRRVVLKITTFCAFIVVKTLDKIISITNGFSHSPRTEIMQLQ